MIDAEFAQRTPEEQAAFREVVGRFFGGGMAPGRAAEQDAS